MKTISMTCSAMMLCTSAIAGIDLSIEKDVVEIGVTAAVTKNTYLYIGGDSDNWTGIGLGYHTFINSNWKLASYYEYGLRDDWVLEELVGVDGVKTKTHLIALSATRFEYHYAEDKSDMLDFNQGQASELELSMGTMRPIWHIYPYAKVSAFNPHGTYYGMTETNYSWTVGGRMSF